MRSITLCFLLGLLGCGAEIETPVAPMLTGGQAASVTLPVAEGTAR